MKEGKSIEVMNTSQMLIRQESKVDNLVRMSNAKGERKT
jgi:hypothetical protein